MTAERQWAERELDRQEAELRRTVDLVAENQRARAGELRRATWWARTWSLAYLWRERRINPRTRDMIESREPGEKTILRATRVKISSVQSWRVHKHEKYAWSRLEHLGAGA